MSRTLDLRAQHAVIALWAVTAAAVLDAYAYANRLQLVQDAVNNQVGHVPLALPQSTVNRADLYVTLGSLVLGVATLAAAITWLRFQHLAHEHLAPRMHGWTASPRTGVVVWLVPFVGLIAPALVLAAMLRAAGSRSVLIVSGWAVCWVGTAVLSLAGLRHPQALADQRLPDGLAIGGNVLLLAAAVISIGIARRLLDGIDALGAADPPAYAASA